MLAYKRILYHMSSVASIRMTVGAISVIYMLQSSVSLAEVAYIKSLQAMVLISCSIMVANFMSKFNRKYFYLLSILACFAWFFTSFIGGVYKVKIYFYIAEVFN